MNYLKHFRLRELPFGITPDTSYFFACRSIQEALNTLLIAVSNGEGFIKITGEVGTGKTLLCRKFLSTLGPSWVSAYIPNPNLEPRSLLLALADDSILRNTDRTVSKRELVILLKPTLIVADRNWEQDIEQTRGRLESLNQPSLRGPR